jgi:phage N-6-adenine-methyltransferase
MLVQHMSNSEEWYTPAYLIHLVKDTLGEIELDPASCELANNVVQAHKYYDIHRDGLAQDWRAKTVFLNPPYCRKQALWITRLIYEYEHKRVDEAILLCKAATETKWFQPLYHYQICFHHGRIKFYSPHNKSKDSMPMGSAIVYLGHNVTKFISVFNKVGTCIRRIEK